MKNNTESRYRIIYEALSLFSGKLSKCESFEAVAKCLFANMKYILEFQLLRLSFYHNEMMISYTLNNKECSFERNKTLKLWKQETLFKSEKAPVLMPAENVFINDLAERNISLKEVPKDIWGWNFELQDNCGILVTLATDEEKKFSKSDVPVLRLVVENISSKLLTLKLIQELDIKKSELEKTIKTLKQTNETISGIVSKQDDLIEKRTAEIKEKNRRLLQISKHNAHNVREPLSRILGVLMMLEQSPDSEVLNEFLPMLYKSSADLDKAVNTTIRFVDEQIIKMKNYDTKDHAGG